MSVRIPKGSSLYYYEFQFKGGRFYGSTGTADEAQAKIVEGKAREKAWHDHYFPEQAKARDEADEKANNQLTLDQAFGRYFTEVSVGSASEYNHERYIKKLLWLGKDRLLSDLTSGDVARLVAHRRGQKAKRKKTRVSNATVNRETELLARVIKRAKKVWKVEVGEDIDWGDHILPEADERIRELTPDEEQAVFTHLRADYHAMVRFALTAGMRLANIIRLTWKQVDFVNRQIVIKMKSRKPGGRVHSVPITPRMYDLLQAEKDRHPIYVFTYECQKSTKTRRRKERYPFTASGWRKPWKSALAAAGVTDFRFHDTRHTAATRIVRKTGNLKIAQKLLGHADLSSTTRYAHVTQDDVRAALTAVESQESPKVDVNSNSKAGNNV